MLFAAEAKFPVKVKGTELVLNDGTNRRIFLSGMVANDSRSGEQLIYNNFIWTALEWNRIKKVTPDVAKHAGEYLFTKGAMCDTLEIAGLFDFTKSSIPTIESSIKVFGNQVQINGYGKFKIFDLLGNQVHVSQLKGKTTLTLKKGFYFIKVISPNGEFWVEDFSVY